MQKEQLEMFIQQGLSSYQIANKLNKSQTTIRYWLNKHNLKTNPRQSQKVQNTPDGIFKKCSRCHEIKEITKENFYVRMDGRFHVWCRQCLNKITSENQIKNKLKAVEYKGGRCSVCQYDKYYGALEFHHLNPDEKDFNLSRKNYSFEKLRPELDKCICVCSNCHREIHAGLIKINGGPSGLG